MFNGVIDILVYGFLFRPEPDMNVYDGSSCLN